jgi:hypothetical protein
VPKLASCLQIADSARRAPSFGTPHVFFFEGDSATAAVEALSRSPRVLNAAVRWRGILAGRPRLAEERFGWTRSS